MSGADNRSKDLIRLLVDAGERAASERRADWEQVWTALIDADARLARLRDDPDVRGEVEGLAAAWRHEIEEREWVPEVSRSVVADLVDRVGAIKNELIDLAEDARALSRAMRGHDLASAAEAVWLSLIDAFEAMELPRGHRSWDKREGALTDAPANEEIPDQLRDWHSLEKAASALRSAPIKAGGPGEYTQGLRPRPVSEFGRSMVPLFRRVGISIGGNATKDKAFETFLDLMHQHVEGRPLPSKAKILAELRKY